MDRRLLIDIKKECGWNQKELEENLLALSKDSDPYFVGTRTDYAQAKWARKMLNWVQAKWDDRKHKLAEMGISVGTKPHLRGIHYIIFTGYPNPTDYKGDPYEGNNKDWKNLQKAFRMGRLLKLIKFGEIEDHKHPEVKKYLHRYPDSQFIYPETPSINEEITTDNFEINFESDIQDKLSVYSYFINPSATGLKSITKRTPAHIEIWTEKERELVHVVAKEYDVNVQDAAGEQSYENVYSLLVRAKESSEGMPIRILYLTDFDPRGEFTIPVAVARKIEWMTENLDEFKDMDVRLKKLMLTEAQVNEFNLARSPVKIKESMRARWEKKYEHEYVVEIDAMETLHAPEMVNILRDELSKYIDKDAVEYIRAYNEKVRKKGNEYMDKVNDKVETIKNDIMEYLEPEIKKKINETLDKLAPEMDVDMTDDLNDFKKVVDEWEEPEWNINEDNADVWLYDSNRNYIEQIKYYNDVRS